MGQPISSGQIEIHMPAVLWAIKRLNISSAGYDDAVQVGRIAVWGALKSYRDGKNTKLSSWVYLKIQGNLKDWMDRETRLRNGEPFDCSRGNDAADWAPKRSTISSESDDCYEDGVPHSWALSGDCESQAQPDMALSSKRTKARVQVALEDVSPALAIVALSIGSEDSGREASKRCGVSRATVARRKKALQQALAPLRGLLDD